MNRRQMLKLEVIDAMGGQCKCCGADHPDFLTIDHVNNDGSSERKNYWSGAGSSWKRVKNQNYPSHYQLLCFNCNYSKYLGGGVCAHKRTMNG